EEAMGRVRLRQRSVLLALLLPLVVLASAGCPKRDAYGQAMDASNKVSDSVATVITVSQKLYTSNVIQQAPRDKVLEVMARGSPKVTRRFVHPCGRSTPAVKQVPRVISTRLRCLWMGLGKRYQPTQTHQRSLKPHSRRSTQRYKGSRLQLVRRRQEVRFNGD